MADVKITALPAATTIAAATDVLPLVTGGGATTSKATPAQVVTAALTATKVTVAQGGTGVGTLTGYVKGSGTANLTASPAVPLTDLNFDSPSTPPEITGRGQIVFKPNGGNTTSITLDELLVWIRAQG